MKRQNKYSYVKNLVYDEYGQRTSITYGNNVITSYTYDQKTRRLFQLVTIEPTKGRIIQNLRYDYDLVGNIMTTNNTAPVPQGGELGGPTEQNYTYDDLYQLIAANGVHTPAPNKRTQYTNNLEYDIIGNITRKVQAHLVITGTDTAQEPRETNYGMDYLYKSAKPHAVTEAGDKLYTYDLNGNMTGWTSKTTNATRIIVWNEENRVKEVRDSGNGTSFLYNDGGERVIKRGGGNESVYLNRFYSLKNGDLGSKHVFAGETRVVTKIEKDGGSLQSGIPGSIAFANSQGLQNAILSGSGQKKGINRRLPNPDGTTTLTNHPPLEKFEFFYHGDHLGSSSFITDDLGAVYQHLEYFPYGETWVEEGGSGQAPGYKFTGKELDPETGLYYYGARYYDPVLSRWISADPILGSYLPTGNKEKDKNLPGFGGVFNPIKLNLYGYVSNRPLHFVDPLGLTEATEMTWYDYEWRFNEKTAQVFKNQPVEHAMFKEYASQITVKSFEHGSYWDSEQALRNYQSAWKGFEFYAKERAPQIISSGIGEFYKDQFGLLSWIKLEGLKGVLLEAYKAFGDVKGAAELIDLTKEALDIMKFGPAVINEESWGRPYDPTVLPYDPSTQIFAPKLWERGLDRKKLP